LLVRRLIAYSTADNNLAESTDRLNGYSLCRTEQGTAMKQPKLDWLRAPRDAFGDDVLLPTRLVWQVEGQQAAQIQTERQSCISKALARRHRVINLLISHNL
jgi:hypothetical protein